MRAEVMAITTIRDSAALLRLMQLVSPALPIGAFAYSQGLESAVELGWVQDEDSARQWILDILQYGLGRTEGPIFQRQYIAWQQEDIDEALAWNDWLLAQRESFELRQEDVHLGQNLRRLLQDLQLDGVESIGQRPALAYVSAFSWAAWRWNIPMEEGLGGFYWSWAEQQVAAAIKLVPLGQTAGQRILGEVTASMTSLLQHSLHLPDQAIGQGLPGLALASVRHETQYSRLFRS